MLRAWRSLGKLTFEHLHGDSHGGIRLNEAVCGSLDHFPKGPGTQSFPCRGEESKWWWGGQRTTWVISKSTMKELLGN